MALKIAQKQHFLDFVILRTEMRQPKSKTPKFVLEKDKGWPF